MCEMKRREESAGGDEERVRDAREIGEMMAREGARGDMSARGALEVIMKRWDTRDVWDEEKREMRRRWWEHLGAPSGAPIEGRQLGKHAEMQPSGALFDKAAGRHA